MTLEEYLRQQGYDIARMQDVQTDENGGQTNQPVMEYGRNINYDPLSEEAQAGYSNYFQRAPTDLIQSYYDIQQPTPQPTPEPVVAQPTPQPTPEPVVAQPTPQQPTRPTAPVGSLEEFIQQQGYNLYRPDEIQVNENGAQINNPGANWYRMGRMDRSSPDWEGGEPYDFYERAPSSLTKSYYDNLYNQERQTPVGQGVNTFNEGNEDQKKIVDKINTGQLQIVPKEYNIDFTKAGGQLNPSEYYDLRDSRTGQIIQQQVLAIDPSKGIFSIGADDPNSSGYFTNFVSTDSKGFVNPIVSEQQSQYNSHANNSLNFIKDSVKGLLQMAAIAATAGGAGAALGSATGAGTTAGNIALNTGINALKQGIDGQFNPLGLATSAALSYGLGGAEGADPLTADDMYTGQAMTNLASSDDVTRLADLVRAFENPTELTGPTIDVALNPTVELGNATVDESLGLPNVPKDLQNEAYLDPGLIDVAPENVTIGTPDTPTYYDASPTFPTLNVSPEYDPSAYLPTNLGGYTGVPTDLSGLDVPFDTTKMDIGFKNPDLTAGELTVTGERPYVPFEENFPLPYEPYEENYPTQTETPTETPTTPKILSNILKSTPSALPKAIATQQQSNLANILRGSQMPQTALPPIYHQANPFNFGQQATPVQDVSALAKLLRTA